ncbi:hypothetical protein ABZ614_11555 [Streptomyces sp. NPDC013178]|uniref:hypothetical protein n=1 Tax=Streptomyces sp. NPDC013178 TaxID=3155118 RepID=UPI0033F405AF
MTSNKRKIAVLGASIAMAATGVLAGAGNASASTVGKGHVKVCAQGNYVTRATFWQRGEFSTTLIPPGKCWSAYMGGSGTEYITVYGKFNTSDKMFYIQTVPYNGSVDGVGIGARGTTANAGAGAYVVTW